jgi:hypothetical protein
MVSTRSIATSPFNSTGLYYSGFDGNFTAVHNTHLSIACNFADGSDANRLASGIENSVLAPGARELAFA